MVYTILLQFFAEAMKCNCRETMYVQDNKNKKNKKKGKKGKKGANANNFDDKDDADDVTTTTTTHTNNNNASELPDNDESVSASTSSPLKTRENASVNV